jgi:hypothetical protein
MFTDTFKFSAHFVYLSRLSSLSHGWFQWCSHTSQWAPQADGRSQTLLLELILGMIAATQRSKASSPGGGKE